MKVALNLAPVAPVAPASPTVSRRGSVSASIAGLNLSAVAGSLKPIIPTELTAAPLPGQEPTAEPTIDPVHDRLLADVLGELTKVPTGAKGVIDRILGEVGRVCSKSDRIQASGESDDWLLSLARHRLQKCLRYYQLGSQRGRADLHGSLSAIVYRYIAPAEAQLSFQGRVTLIEDFMQAFYVEALRAFRRENNLGDQYQPQTRIELAEYLAFTEQYAKRRISLPGCRNQQLIVLRAKTFARRQPPELAIDMELAVESGGKTEEAEAQSRSSAVQQVRAQMVAEAVDPAEAVLRDRITRELIDYLKSQNQEQCIDYLVLKLQDLSAPEIDAILELTPRERDYLQQRFKYHVERFARMHQWEMVHQWLGADLDTRLGLDRLQWQTFRASLTAQQSQLLDLKQAKLDDAMIMKQLRCTPKQLQKRWFELLSLAARARNAEAA